MSKRNARIATRAGRHDAAFLRTVGEFGAADKACRAGRLVARAATGGRSASRI